MEKVLISIAVIDNEIEWVKSSSMSNVNSNGCIAAHYYWAVIEIDALPVTNNDKASPH